MTDFREMRWAKVREISNGIQTLWNPSLQKLLKTLDQENQVRDLVIEVRESPVRISRFREIHEAVNQVQTEYSLVRDLPNHEVQELGNQVRIEFSMVQGLPKMLRDLPTKIRDFENKVQTDILPEVQNPENHRVQKIFQSLQ